MRDIVTHIPDPIDKGLVGLLEGSKRGDLASFEAIVRRYQQYAYSLAMKFFSDADEASDIVQESFVRVWKHLGRYDSRQKFTTWFYKIVANLCIDRLRSLERHRRLFLSQEGELQTLADTRDWSELQHRRHVLEIIRILAAALPPTQRTVFTLRDLQDLDVDEVAEITGLSVGSVKTNLHHARKFIRGALIRDYDIDENKQ